MKKNKGTHKQSKYFTIMLVPDSAAKVRRLRIPYWVLSVVGIPFVCILIVAVLFQTRVVNLESLLDQSAMRLSETIDENDSLRESLLSAEANHEMRNDPPPLEQSPVLIQYVTNEAEIAELLERLEAIDGMKQGIISVFNELSEHETFPFMFDEDTLRGGVVRAQGGAYAGSPEDIIAGLDSVLLEKLIDMLALIELAEDLEAYFRARPTGWPVFARNIGSEFGYRLNAFTGYGLERHDGVDISVPEGTDVFATAYGVVTFAGWHTGGFGYLVIIEHDFDYETYYAHNSEVLVAVGDEVVRGQAVALSGNTGRSTSPHCHYEVRNNGLARNPRGFLD
jgi:murein DD-endopeptidase MepM/ murein hydrolase activator NlpD